MTDIPPHQNRPEHPGEAPREGLDEAKTEALKETLEQNLPQQDLKDIRAAREAASDHLENAQDHGLDMGHGTGQPPGATPGAGAARDLDLRAKNINIKVETTEDEVIKESAKRGFLSNPLSIEAGQVGKFVAGSFQDGSQSGQMAHPKSSETAPKSREFTLPKDTDVNDSANAGAFFPIGLRQHFQLRKAEFKSANEDKNLETFRPGILDLLAKTQITDDKNLTSAEKAGLYDSRDCLLGSQDIDEALSNALHLARLYQHLRYIEEAKRATYLALGIDPDNQLGKQLLKELERVHPVDIGIRQTVPQSHILTKSALKNRILNLTGGKVCVVGDLLIDELIEGMPERISREAPVLILEHVDTVLIPGGAANTAHNVSALNGKCHAIGVCGRDDYAPKLAQLLEDHGISHDLVEDESRPTTIKTRIVSKSHSMMQQLLRIDRISHQKVSADIEAILVESIERAAATSSAIILSDYKSGAITDGVINAVRKCAEKHNTMVIVDAQGSFERFAGCTLMAPNQPDAEAAAGFRVTSKESLQKLGDILLARSSVKALLLTRGGEGMVLFEQGKPMFELHAFNRNEVYDVTGAGDTVVATMALALTTGASLPEAMALGNLAASIVVRKPGTEVTSQKEMLEHLELLHLPD
jgi:rfaE bifunctional protein kinase chain/domain